MNKEINETENNLKKAVEELKKCILEIVKPITIPVINFIEKILDRKILKWKGVRMMSLEIKGTDEIPTKFEEFKIVGVKYEDRFEKKTFTGREYSYYSNIEDIKVGDIVEVPTRYGKSIAEVVRTDIDKKEIEKIKQYMKIIEIRLDKEKFFNGKEEE